MKIFKTLTLIAAAAAAAMPAAAEESYALLEPEATIFYVLRGWEFEIPLNLNNTIIPSAFQYYLTLPDGLALVKNGPKYDVTYNTSRIDKEVYTIGTSIVNGTNTYLFTAYNNIEYNYAEYDEYRIQPGTGEFVRVKVSVSDSMPTGDYEMVLNNILFVTLDETAYHSPNATMIVRVCDHVTGLEDVGVDTVADNIYYDLTGRRVDNPAPGIYIRNGKKVLVK